MKIIFYFLFCSLLIPICQIIGEGWPRWRGSLGNGTWSGPDLLREIPTGGLELKWKLPIAPGYSGVTVADGMAFLMDKPNASGKEEQERVLCVDVDTGKLAWSFTYPVDYKKLDYGKGPRASITTDAGQVFGLGAMGHAFCLDGETGKKIWFRNLVREENCPPPIWGFSCSPEPLGENVLYHVGGPTGNLIALDKSNGKTKWRTGSDKRAGYAPPLSILHNGFRQLVCWGPNKIMGLPIGGGEEFWNIPYEVKYGVSIAKPIFVEGVILVCGYWNGSRAIQLSEDSKEATLLWSEEEGIRGLMAQPLFRDGIVYLLDRSHGLTAFRLKTGEILWRDEHNLTAADRNPHASLVWLSDKGNDVLALNAEGELVYLSLTVDGFNEHWREQIVGETWAHPAYSGNLVLARDDRSLFCWKLPVKLNQ